MAATSDFSSAKMSRLQICLCLVGFLDFLGVGMLIPHITNYLSSLGATPGVIGAVMSVYGVLQFFSGPMVGRCSDLFGRHLVLFWCLLLTGISYGLMGLTNSVAMVALTRIPLGIVKQTQSLAKSYLADITPKNQRAAIFGRYNAISTAGFIVGPVIGGYIAEDSADFNKVCSLTFITFMVNVGLVFFFVSASPKEHVTRTPSVEKFTSDDYSIKVKNFFATFKKIAKTQPDLFAIRFLSGLSMMLFRSNFTLLLEQRFETTPKINGWIISYGSLISTLSGMMVGRVVFYYKDIARLLRHSSTGTTIALICMTLSPSLTWFVVFSTCLSVFNAIARVCAVDIGIQRGGLSDTGSLLGLTQSVMSVSRAMAPLLSGMAMEYSTYCPSIIATILAASGIALQVAYPQHYHLSENGKKKDN
ncbi:major facilitator superfamily domain-containing protein 9-like isoform X1 [Anneissia japonica]|uniref:major facilitator superfamily domain-containing protein 9-like isoform X1 n=2 Tax=Anneissia japonica TaxID=1529436 RepID=UPI001425A104|nr:major facilitator superfamily domain-containing protein 9-like isoform X1 [Anneissia japonica]